jgi:DNA-directed RNA polymerase subunit RPC12/RpoP
MALWALRCENCFKEFAHSVTSCTDTATYLFPPEPDVETADYECPYCGHTASYKRYDLIYQG